jgi:hypothetical protein
MVQLVLVGGRNCTVLKGLFRASPCGDPVWAGTCQSCIPDAMEHPLALALHKGVTKGIPHTTCMLTNRNPIMKRKEQKLIFVVVLRLFRYLF